jgi:hypothetical protein
MHKYEQVGNIPGSDGEWIERHSSTPLIQYHEVKRIVFLPRRQLGGLRPWLV